MSIKADISAYKAQLHDFLSQKYVDQSLLLGFNSVVQGKFHAWIVADANAYYQSQENGPSENAQQNTPFSTIEYFEQLWTDFHYPIVKFFQQCHAGFFGEVLADFQQFQKGRGNREKAAFRVKLVEIRKINDNFAKFTKQAHDFYHGLMCHFSVHFCNPILPKQFLSEFDLKVPETALETSNANLQANLVFLVHRCLLYLGNLSRHRAFVELSYVNPCLSTGNFWKYRGLSHSAKTKLMKPSYKMALSYYRLCILLLPALNESYNHMGMIHNLVDEKYDAVYWFLRSQSTRLPDYTLGHANLIAVLKKDWFLLELVTAYTKRNLSHATMGDLFVCLMGHFYMPEQYKRGANIVRNYSFSQVERDFLNVAFGSFADDEKHVHLQQLVMLMAVQKLMEAHKHANLLKFNRFLGRYFETLFKASVFDTERQRAKVLACARLVFSFIRESKLFFSYLKTKEARSTISIICDFVNSLLSSVDSNDADASGHETISQDSTFNTIVELLKSSARPLRGYYFEEDVLLKDFLPIKFQFKDFKDDHLFASNNINLLVGDYSSYYSDSDMQIPSFLGNDTVTRICKRFEGTCAPASKVRKVVAKEIAVYENDLRMQAVLAFSKKFLELVSCYFDVDSGRFVRKNAEVKDIQKRPKKASKKERLPKPSLSQAPLAQGTQMSQVSFETSNGQDAPQKASNGHFSPHQEANGKAQGPPNGSPTVLVNSTALPAILGETSDLHTSLEQIQSSILSHADHLRDTVGSPQNTVNTSAGLESTILSESDAAGVPGVSQALLGYDTGSGHVFHHTQELATEVDHAEREQGFKSMVDSLVVEQNASGNSQPPTVGGGGNIWANGASQAEHPLGFQNGPVIFHNTPPGFHNAPGMFQGPPAPFQGYGGPRQGPFITENAVSGPAFAPGMSPGPQPPYRPYTQQQQYPPYGQAYAYAPGYAPGLFQQ